MFGVQAEAFAYLQGVNHHIAILQTGTGLRKGTKSGDTTDVPVSDCTIFVTEVLEQAFKNQGRSEEWERVRKRYYRPDFSGIELQIALQSELNWRGIFWAPDPNFKYPERAWGTAMSSEPATAYKAVRNGRYYPQTKGGLAIHKLLIKYAPEDGSTTTKDTSGLDNIKKIPFGVLSAHGAVHMCLICNGNVCEVHWSKTSKDADLYQETPLENWGGIHKWGCGAIVVPPWDMDHAWP